MSRELVDLTPLVISVIMVFIVAITTYIAPYIKSYIKTKLTAEQTQNLFMWTEVAVKAAEQLCKSGVIKKEERKEHVLNFLHSKGLTINLDEVETLIESFVKDLPPLITSGVDQKTEKDE